MMVVSGCTLSVIQGKSQSAVDEFDVVAILALASTRHIGSEQFPYLSFAT